MLGTCVISFNQHNSQGRQALSDLHSQRGQLRSLKAEGLVQPFPAPPGPQVRDGGPGRRSDLPKVTGEPAPQLGQSPVAACLSRATLLLL